MIKKILMSCALLVSSFGQIYGMYLMRPYEQMLRPEMRPDYCFQMSLLGEHGFNTLGLDEDGNKVNVLRIWNQDQNALKMLEGFDPASPIGQRRILIGANDDGVRGHFDVHGDLDYQFGCAFSGRLGFCHGLSVSAYLPYYRIKLTNVSWHEKTLNLTADDARVKSYLTNDFFANVAQLGGLNLQGWSRAGIGDLTLMAEWIGDFKQKKDLLHNVRLQARLALLVPTGKKGDEDLIFALPFGNDGAFGLLLGGGLTLTIACYLRLGVDVELTHLFSTTRTRRIKTQRDQTELLLLQKADVLRDYGLLQRFNVYAELYRILGGLSCKVGYQFFRHNDDTFTVCSSQFSTAIANTAKSLEEWTLHNMFFIMSYDGEHDECKKVHPYVSAYVKIPFNGQFMSSFKTVGLMISLDF
jgi:hypothetical protein